VSGIYYIDYPAPDLDLEGPVLTEAGLSLIDGKLRPPESLESRLRSSLQVIVVTFTRVDTGFLDRFSGLELLLRHGTGHDNIDLEACQARGIRVMNIVDYCQAEISSYIHKELTDFFPTHASKHKVSVGIIGLGRIGRVVRRSLEAHGFRITFHTRTPLPQDSGYRSLASLLESVDVLSLHASLNESSHHLLNTPEFGRMKPGMLLMNTARGSLIHSRALLHAINAGVVRQAILDVIDPATPPEVLARLRESSAVKYTGHSAWYSPRALWEIRLRLLAAILAWTGNHQLRENILA